MFGFANVERAEVNSSLGFADFVLVDVSDGIGWLV